MSGFFLLLFLSVLTGMGVGSGGFYLLYLVDTLGVPQYEAQGANLLFFLLASLASTLVSLRAGRLRIARLLPMLLWGYFGVGAGALLTLLVSPSYARRAFGALLLFGGALSLLDKGRRKAEKYGDTLDKKE